MQELHLPKKIGHHFIMHILDAYAENYISLKDALCKNGDACLKIPYKDNHLSKHKYTYKNISTPITTSLG